MKSHVRCLFRKDTRHIMEVYNSSWIKLTFYIIIDNKSIILMKMYCAVLSRMWTTVEQTRTNAIFDLKLDFHTIKKPKQFIIFNQTF